MKFFYCLVVIGELLWFIMILDACHQKDTALPELTPNTTTPIQLMDTAEVTAVEFYLV